MPSPTDPSPNDLAPTGIHHVSALTNDIRTNHAFYTTVMGMRLVKRTVNQDDPSMYHLFYADGAGTPGSDLTYFDMPRAARERPGNRSITRTTLRVDGEAALGAWRDRFDALGVPHGDVTLRRGRLHLDFEDPHGLPLALVDDGGVGPAHPWDASPVPAAQQVRGLGSVEITVPELGPTHAFLTDVLHLEAEATYPPDDGTQGAVHVYRMHADGPAGELHVAVVPDRPNARYGSGGVHHLALRVPNDAAYHAWSARLARTGRPFSGEVDRHYFRSLYVREPGGILVELATDGPGFDVDEPRATLGEQLALPPFLEPRRAQIEARLAPLD